MLITGEASLARVASESTMAENLTRNVKYKGRTVSPGEPFLHQHPASAFDTTSLAPHDPYSPTHS